LNKCKPKVAKRIIINIKKNVTFKSGGILSKKEPTKSLIPRTLFKVLKGLNSLIVLKNPKFPADYVVKDIIPVITTKKSNIFQLFCR